MSAGWWYVGLILVLLLYVAYQWGWKFGLFWCFQFFLDRLDASFAYRNYCGYFFLGFGCHAQERRLRANTTGELTLSECPGRWFFSSGLFEVLLNHLYFVGCGRFGDLLIQFWAFDNIGWLRSGFRSGFLTSDHSMGGTVPAAWAATLDGYTNLLGDRLVALFRTILFLHRLHLRLSLVHARPGPLWRWRRFPRCQHRSDAPSLARHFHWLLMMRLPGTVICPKGEQVNMFIIIPSGDQV